MFISNEKFDDYIVCSKSLAIFISLCILSRVQKNLSKLYKNRVYLPAGSFAPFGPNTFDAHYPDQLKSPPRNSRISFRLDHAGFLVISCYRIFNPNSPLKNGSAKLPGIHLNLPLE